MKVNRSVIKVETKIEQNKRQEYMNKISKNTEQLVKAEGVEEIDGMKEKTMHAMVGRGIMKGH